MTELIANRYRYLDQLGKGAMGEVWLVEDQQTNKQVALKRVFADLGEEGALRFRQEFRLMAQLKHPHCCEVYDYGELPDGAPYFTMEVVPGHGLNEMRPMSRDDVMALAPQLLNALGYVHQLGFVHRDLKDENVRVKPDGTVKLMDFGLMEYAGASDLPISGTLGYLAPEIIKRGPVDQRADLYALGVLLYELVAGKLPFDRQTRVEIMRAHASEPPPPLPGSDSMLGLVVSKLLAKEPTDRFQSAGEVLEALGFEADLAMRTLLTAPMIGRDYETMQLFDALGNLVGDGLGSTVLIQGAPGIGKSRLVKEFRSAVQLETNLPFVSGRGRGENATPYGPFREVLRELLPAFREYIPAMLKAHGAVLASLLPELSDEPAPEIDDASKEKVRLQGVVTTLLVALAAKQPFVLVLEDWHAADSLSVELLDYLQRNLKGLPILCLVTTRPPLEGLEWGAEAAKLNLSKLGEAAVTRVVAAILGIEVLAVAPHFAQAIARLSEGNPFYVERLLEQLVAQGLLAPKRGGWETNFEVDSGVLPRDLQGLVMRKLASLPEDAITVARIGAVLGRSFDLGLLKELTGFRDERLFDALGALQREQVLAIDDDKAYGWAQELFKELVYESFKPEHRTAMHAKVAQALERRVGKGKLREAPFELVKNVADHYMLSGQPDRIVTFALEVGRRNANLFATREAEHYLATSLTLLRADTSPRLDKPRLLALRLLGDTRRLSGNVQTAKEMYLEAIPLAQKIGASTYLARMFTALADCYTSEDNILEALQCCERALEISLQAGDKASSARSYLTSCILRFMGGDLAGSIQQNEQALALAREVGDTGTEAEALAFLGHLYVATVPERASEGVAHLEAAIKLLAEASNKVSLQNAYNLLGAAQYKRGDFQAAGMAFDANRKICFELGLKEEEAYALLNQSITGYELGKLVGGVSCAESADALAAEYHLGVVHALAVTFGSAGQAYMGNLHRATEMMREAVALFQASNNKFLEARILEHRVAFLLLMGRLAEAKETAEGLQKLLAETGNTEPEGHVLAMLGEIRARLGEMEAAQADLTAALAIARAGEAKGLEVHALKAQAWIALREEKFEEAAEIARRALLVSHQAATRYQTAELLGIMGEAYLAIGSSEAFTYFQNMTEHAEAMQAKLLEALGIFGQAAARPYDGEAKARADRARRLVNEMVAGLDPEAVDAFWGQPERQRVMQGNYIDYSIKKQAAKAVPPPLPGMGFGGGGNW